MMCSILPEKKQGNVNLTNLLTLKVTLSSAQVCCGEGAEPEGEAVNLPVDLCFKSKVCAQALGGDRKKEIVGASSRY